MYVKERLEWLILEFMLKKDEKGDVKRVKVSEKVIRLVGWRYGWGWRIVGVKVLKRVELER